MTSATWPLTAELLLLLLDEQGRLRLDSTKRTAAVAGATVVELVLDGALDLADGGTKRARLVADTAVTPRTAMLAQARERAANHTPKDAVARIGGASDWKGRADDLQESVLRELADAGVVEPVAHTRFGVLRSTRWVVRRPDVISGITQRVAAALDSGEPDVSTAALISILDAIDVLPRIFPERDRKALRRQARQIDELQWGGRSVAQAIREVRAVIATSVIAASVAATG